MSETPSVLEMIAVRIAPGPYLSRIAAAALKTPSSPLVSSL